MPIDPLFRGITLVGDTDQLVVGVSNSLEYLFRNSVPTFALAAARVFDVQLVLHGAILACPADVHPGLNASLRQRFLKQRLNRH